jgi:hypothetical protein
MNKKQWVKIALLSAPIIALVIASLAGLGAETQTEIQEIITNVIIVVAGAIGVTGIAMNNDKDGNGIPDDKE